MTKDAFFRPFIALIAAFAFLMAVCPPMEAAAEAKPLTPKEAEALLSSFLPGAKIISVEPSAIKGLWEVAMESRGSKGIVYIDSERKRVVLGSIIEITTRQNLTEKKFQAISPIDFSSIPTDDAVLMGKKNAAKKAIVFDDPD